MKQITAPSRIKDGTLYFLRKGSGWYRPKAEGYTNNLADAGLYDASYTRKCIAAHDGKVHAVSQKSARDAIWQEMRELIAKAAKLGEIALRI